MRTPLAQHFKLHLCLYAFRNNCRIQSLCQRNHSGSDCLIFGTAVYPAYVGAVDLDNVYWQVFEVADCRLSRTKIVNRNSHADFLETMNLFNDFRPLIEHAAFTKFDLEPGGIKPVMLERLLYDGNNVAT